jgi:hypothetical protein
MKKQNIFFIVSVVVVVFGVVFLFASPKSEVKYPEGYRNWTHVKTLILDKNHPLYKDFGGMHHIYANQTALKGYNNGGKFKDGSIIIFDLFDAVSADNAISEGNRKVLAVMEKDSKRFKDTGGWGFEGFKGDTKERVVKNMYADCFSCHLSQKDNNYVFSKYRK